MLFRECGMEVCLHARPTWKPAWEEIKEKVLQKNKDTPWEPKKVCLTSPHSVYISLTTLCGPTVMEQTKIQKISAEIYFCQSV